MKEKKIYQRLREEAALPMEPDSQRLLDALELSLPERQEVSAPKQKRVWLPVVAVSCTAAIAIGVCVPVYLNLQGQTAIIEPGGQTSSTAEGKRKLVWSFEGQDQADAVYSISDGLQTELDKPENEDALFRVLAEWHIYAVPETDADFLYEGETYQEICAIKQQAYDYVLEKYKIGLTGSDGEKCWNYIDADAYGGDWEAYLAVVEKEENFQRYKKKMIEYTAKEQAARELFSQQYVENTIKELERGRKALGIIEEPVTSTSDDIFSDTDRLFYANLTKEQITELAKGPYRLNLAPPLRPDGYVRQISDYLAIALEYSERETYWVRVNSVLCARTSYGNNDWNADLIRELKEEEITQKFGEDFLAAIRSRHGIDEEYIPTWGEDIRWISKTESITVPFLADWYVPGDAPGESHIYGQYNGGFFEAKLTKEQVLELAQDSDVRTIYLSQKDPGYFDARCYEE